MVAVRIFEELERISKIHRSFSESNDKEKEPMKKPIQKIATKFAALALATTALTGVGVVGEVATAEAAQAGTLSSCRVVDAGYGRTLGTTGKRYGAYCYANYDWTEEFFLGYRDGWKFVWFSNNKCDLRMFVPYIAGC
jgi:hypothetical protein